MTINPKVDKRYEQRSEKRVREKNKPEGEETRGKCTRNQQPSISSLPSFDITGGMWREKRID